MIFFMLTSYIQAAWLINFTCLPATLPSLHTYDYDYVNTHMHIKVYFYKLLPFTILMLYYNCSACMLCTFYMQMQFHSCHLPGYTWLMLVKMPSHLTGIQLYQTVPSTIVLLLTVVYVIHLRKQLQWFVLTYSSQQIKGIVPSVFKLLCVERVKAAQLLWLLKVLYNIALCLF